MTFGERLNASIKAAGISVVALSDTIKRDRTTVYKYIRDEVIPTIDVVAAMADALHVHPAYLLGWVNNPNITAKELAQMDEPVMFSIIQSASRLQKDQKADVLGYARYLGQKPKAEEDHHE